MSWDSVRAELDGGSENSIFGVEKGVAGFSFGGGDYIHNDDAL